MVKSKIHIAHFGSNGGVVTVWRYLKIVEMDNMKQARDYSDRVI